MINNFFDYLNVFYEQQIKLNNDIINNIKPYQIQTQLEFITIYKKEMPKGGYFEGCTLELVTLNKNFICAEKELKDNQEKFDMVVNGIIGKLPFPFNLILEKWRK